MKYKVAELEGGLLDAAVAKAKGKRFKVRAVAAPGGAPIRYFVRLYSEREERFNETFFPSQIWKDGGPIIERERISLNASDKPHKRPAWEASINEPDDGAAVGYGPTPLIAAMRAYTISKLGEEVDL